MSKTRRAGRSRDPASVLRWSRNSSSCTAARWSPKAKLARDRRSRSAFRSRRRSLQIALILNSTNVPAASRAEAYVEEALSWLPQDPATKFPISQRDVAIFDVGGIKMQGHILVADDNADMRAYIGRLLGAHWDVETAEDGNAAIEAIRRNRPDLVVTDAMMPGLDGFGLLVAIRKDPDLRDLPVIMLSARAGEEARIEGLDAGADYYLTKPFSARELVAQVNANLTLARVRSEAARDLRASEEALRRRTTQFETLLNEAPLGVYLVDADFKIQAVNPTALPVFGDISDLVGRDFGEVIRILWPKDYADEVVRLFRHTLDTGEPYVTPEHIEERRDRKVREYYEWRINRIPLPEGRYGVVCYFREISAYVRARQQRELLINELNHRVKNTLATVQSVAAQTLKGSTVPATVKGALESRLISMAGAHDVLTQQNWEGADLRNIVEKALSPFMAPRREFDVDGPDIRLLPKSALAVAMAVHELATNAAKYGALVERVRPHIGAMGGRRTGCTASADRLDRNGRSQGRGAQQQGFWLAAHRAGLGGSTGR